MKILFGIILICFSIQSNGQQVIGAAGTTTTTTVGSVSYTVGEIAVQTTEIATVSSSDGCSIKTF